MSTSGFEPKLKETRWAPELELELLKKWEEEGLYGFREDARGRLFLIDTPPPYPSGRPWHIGAAAHYTQIDMIARTARMMGYNTYFPIGIDRNGIPVERYVEREKGIRLLSLPRQEFLKICSETLDELESEMLWIMRRAGLSGDFKNYYRTDSPEYRGLTQATFIRLFREGKIYRSTRPNNYCWDCGTTVADAEVDHIEVPTDLVYISFDLVGGGSVTISTTRPELLGACRAVIYNPGDARYSWLEGRRAVVPIYGTEVPIIPHSAAKPDFGSGVVMVCSYGDKVDVQLFRELGLEEVILIGLDGRMLDSAGPLAGLTVQEARRRIIEILEAEGRLVKTERIMHSIPICERSNAPIEIIPMDEYYLSQLPFKEDLLEAASKMTFHPEIHRQLLTDWTNSIKIDWPISRRRYYATEIPVWYCRSCGHPSLPEPGRYYRPWAEKPPFERCERCGGTEFVGEERTLDTWMDSSISPLYISRYMRDEKFFSRAYPVGIRPQGKDIVRTWLYYTLLRCYQLTGKPPFKHVWISGMGLDEKGEKMSKSKGNVIDPRPILEKYGADIFRFWCAQEASLGYDFRISEQRIAAAGRFVTKLWNIARYVSQFPNPPRARLVATDEWILSELAKTAEECMRGYRDFNFFIPSTRLRNFLWNIFADHYIEMTKMRALGRVGTRAEASSAWYALHRVLRTSLLLLAPITPFITDHIWRALYSPRSIHLQKFPKIGVRRDMSEYTEKILEFNRMVWREKKTANLSLRDPISIEVPKELEPFKPDLAAMHNIRM
jgi:valyl-tRNA synthetase